MVNKNSKSYIRNLTITLAMVVGAIGCSKQYKAVEGKDLSSESKDVFSEPGGISQDKITSDYQPPVRKRGSKVLNVKNYGAVGNGIKDDTLAFRKAIAALPSSGGTVYVPDGTYLITPSNDPDKAVALRSYMHLKLASGAKLKAKPNDRPRAYLLYVPGSSEVEISGGELIGERYQHKNKKGEWGHGIQLRGAKRVTIRDMKIRDFWGDGICIGRYNINGTTLNTKDVVINKVVSKNNRRQGLSIGQSSDIRVYNSEFANTNGTAPEYGIDIEPDPVGDFYMRNVFIENNIIRNNRGGGIQVYKGVSNVLIRDNAIYKNYGSGILTIGTENGYIARNRLTNNAWFGVSLRPGTRDYQVSGNYFRNNRTITYGDIKNSSPYRAITGFLAGAYGTTPHVEKGPDTYDIRLTTNFYSQ